MKNYKPRQTVSLVMALTLTLNATSFAQDSKLSEREERLIYPRAFEAILWASPVLAVCCQAEAGTRDLGAGHLDIAYVYMGKKPDYRWGGPRPLEHTIWLTAFSTSIRSSAGSSIESVMMDNLEQGAC